MNGRSAFADELLVLLEPMLICLSVLAAPPDDGRSPSLLCELAARLHDSLRPMAEAHAQAVMECAASERTVQAGGLSGCHW